MAKKDREGQAFGKTFLPQEGDPTKFVPIFNLTVNSSKEEEIRALRQLVDAVRDSGTYMEQLINDQLCAWFEDRLQEDASCDLKDAYETLKDVVHETRVTERQIRESYGKEIERMKEAFQKEHATADTFQKELDQLRLSYLAAITDCDQLVDIIRKLRRKAEVQEGVIKKMKDRIFLIEHPEYDTTTENDDDL